MSIPLPFSNNPIQVFAYERFNFVISNPNIGVYNTMLPVSNTGGFGPSPSPFYFTKTGNTSMTFAISDVSNNLTAGTTESFKVTVTDGSASLVSSNTVSIGPGRFLDSSGASLSNNVYTFFKNEAITPIRLVAPSFTLSVPTSIPALPPGLSFSSNASNEYRIVGTPTVPFNSTSYQIIGVQSGGSKIITTRFTISVGNERLRVDLSGSSIISNMQIGVPIATRVITAIPPVTTPAASIRYTFPVLPDGIVAKNSAGVVQSPGFTASDASYTMIIEGTPTLAAANAFRNAGADSNGLLYTVTATRFNPLPTLSNTIPLTFQFAPTVLFDTPTIDPIYVGVPVNQSTNFFVAKTYFISNFGLSDISSIFSPNLRSDLSLVYVPGSSRADLSGNNPTTVGTATYTIRAINSNGIQRDLSQVISVQNDTVAFNIPPTPIADACYSFILSRPLTSFKPGYYTSNIQFSATAASRLPVTFTAPGLAGTGLSLDSNGFIVGLPTQVTPLTTLSVIADVTGSPATATHPIKFSIVNDTFTFADICANRLTFVENFPIVPIQFPVTTLSDRNIIGYSLSGFPNGLTIDPTGLMTGTPTSSSPTAGNGTVTATTGYASGSRDFSYNITPERILFTFPENIYSFEAGDAVSIQVTGTAYSGGTVGNYALSLPPSYGLTINPTTGLISGILTNSIPPNQLLFADQSFNVTAQVNGVSGASVVDVSAGPIIQNTSFVWAGGTFFSSNPTTSWAVNSNFVNPPVGSGFDIVIKNSNVDGNFILATQVNSIYRSTNANNFTRIPIGTVTPSQVVSSLAFKPGTTKWWASGLGGGFGAANIIESDDNGFTWYPKGDIVTSTNNRVLSRRGTSATFTNPYMYPGIALKYSDGVLLAGGAFFTGGGDVTMLRSTDEGSTWTIPFTFSSELAYFNLDVSGMWIATGSQNNTSADIFTTGRPSNITTNTIKYSTDRGVFWADAVGGFNAIGYELVYANNTWVASGIDGVQVLGDTNYALSLKYSTNGVNWAPVVGVPPITFGGTLIQPTARYAITTSTDLSGGTILDQRGGSPATIINAGYTAYVPASSPRPASLAMRASNGAGVWQPDGGGISTPNISNIYAIEMWISSEDPALPGFPTNITGGEYLVGDTIAFLSGDAIFGRRGGFPTPGVVGTEFLSSTIYIDRVAASTGNPNYNFLTSIPFTPTFYQVFVVRPTPFSGQTLLLTGQTFTTVEGTFIGRVAEVSLYTTPLTATDVTRIYNSKAAIYGKAIVPITPTAIIPIAPLPMGSMNYDGSNWNVFTQTQDSSGTWVTKLYSSPTITAPSWPSVDISFSAIPQNANRRLVTYTRAQYLRPSASRIIDVTLTTNSDLGVGPSISPPSSSFLVYQYVPASLQLSATGTGQIYFFISAEDLPAGLVFNPLTNIISGNPAEQGTFTTTVYAIDDNGISQVQYTFTVNTPRLIRKQDGAGAYTSLLKQYTEVLAAQSARDSRALPTQLVRLGEFMSPVPVAVTTKTFNTNCQNCFREECPVTNAIVDANGAITAVCDFIDANVGDVFDAGNAEANICD